jgi:hypothetical protein
MRGPLAITPPVRGVTRGCLRSGTAVVAMAMSGTMARTNAAGGRMLFTYMVARGAGEECGAREHERGAERGD